MSERKRPERREESDASATGRGGEGALASWVRSGLAAMVAVLLLAGGVIAIVLTPREEEPQIDVPLIDVFVQAPGLTAEGVGRRVVWEIERALYGAEGVEYLYSTSAPGAAVVTARFYVGENSYRAQTRVRDRLERNRHRFPPELLDYQIRPVHVDDVPFMTITLHSATVDSADLLLMGEELLHELTAIEDVGLTFITGGRRLEASIDLDPARLTAHGATVSDVRDAIVGANYNIPAGGLESANTSMPVDVERPLVDVSQLRELIVSVENGSPVMLDDVAEVRLAPAEPEVYSSFTFGPASGREAPGGASLGRCAVTLALAKRPGVNAVSVAEEVLDRLDRLRPELLSDDVEATITRDYGASADNAVNWLVYSLLGASLVVMAVLAAALGLREALIVAVSVPTTFAVALLVNYLAGYTLNRVTLFALIVVLGLIVDDAIVSIDNIHRWLHTSVGKGLSSVAAITRAVTEVVPPMVLTSLVVVVAFVPLAFVTGLMGPYMAPMALAVPVAMISSTAVAALIVPWLALVVFKDRRQDRGEEEDAPSDGPAEGDDGIEDTARYRSYRRLVNPFLARVPMAWGLIVATLALFLAAVSLPLAGLIPLKLLPFDNNEKLQFFVSMPEGTPVERTAAVVDELVDLAARQNETLDVTSYAGTNSPVDFAGLVRGYYLRKGPHVGDVRINFIDDDNRSASSHEIALRLRDEVRRIAERHGAVVEIVERPPGPPVRAPVVAEVRGPPSMSYEDLLSGARRIERLFHDREGLVDVDTSIEEDHPRLIFEVDQQEAKSVGLDPLEIAELVAIAVGGADLDYLRAPVPITARPVRVRLPASLRTDASAVEFIPIARREGRVLTAGELGRFRRAPIEQTIERKDLERVVYVTAALTNQTPVEAVLSLREDVERLKSSGELDEALEVRFDGEGEWFITIRVMRDLAIALGVALLAIYALLVYQTGSYLVSLILITSVPLTLIGIFPGFWLLDALLGGSVDGYRTSKHFTATAMIGILALAGIAVRNAILLIDFAQMEQRRGASVRDAVLRAGALRTRAILLTAGTAMLAVLPIAFDPVFVGLAWSLIFGLFVSTPFTLVLVPTLYVMLFDRQSEANDRQESSRGDS